MNTHALPVLAPSPRQPNRSLVKAIACQAVAFGTGNSHGDALQLAAAAWPRDDIGAVLRAAVAPTTSANAGALLQTAAAAFVVSLASQSAAASLFARGNRVSLGRNNSITLPYSATNATSAWVAEGSAIPVGQSTVTAATIGPLKTLALIETVTQIFADHSVEDTTTIIELLLRQSAARSLDVAVLSTNAATAATPAGIRNGIAALVHGVGSGLAGLLDDVGALLQALTDNNAGTDPVLICAPSRAARLRGWAPDLGIPIFTSVTLPSDVLIAIDAAAFCSATGEPEFNISNDAVVHFEDTNPQGIGVSGSPTVPMRSFFQQNLLGVRLTLKTNWVLRPPAACSWFSGITSW